MKHTIYISSKLLRLREFLSNELTNLNLKEPNELEPLPTISFKPIAESNHLASTVFTCSQPELEHLHLSDNILQKAST